MTGNIQNALRDAAADMAARGVPAEKSQRLLGLLRDYYDVGAQRRRAATGAKVNRDVTNTLHAREAALYKQLSAAFGDAGHAS